MTDCSDIEHPEDRALLREVLAGQRRGMSKAITLIESTHPDHRRRADLLLGALLPRTGGSIRLGISGVPGVGKSTFIESLGLLLVAEGRKVAVLSIDPSSTLSGGSILGDKTRMQKLSVVEAAYIRPTPSSGTLGGVAESTRETIFVCEAAGYDVVIVETVGVGQSETAVASMTDVLALLQLPNAGDDLQAIKKGIIELADVIVINKADLDAAAAARAAGQIALGRHLPVFQASALIGTGVREFWSKINELTVLKRSSGEFLLRRQQQSLAWMWDLIRARLMEDFQCHVAIRAALPETLRAVREGRLAPSVAARQLLDQFERRI